MISRVVGFIKSRISVLLDGNTKNLPDLHSIRIVDKCVSFFQSDNNDDLRALTKNARIVGVIVIVVFFGIFGVWAAFAPIDGASIATGEVVISSDRRVVQHFDGGIIKEILVHEGDHVEEGQILITLNNVNNKAQLAILEENQASLLASEQRLLAHKEKKDEMMLPDVSQLEHVDNDKKNIAIKNQLSLFESHRESFSNQIRIIDKKIEQIRNEVLALEAQLQSTYENLTLLQEELTAKKALYATRVIDKTKITNLEREKASLDGKINEYKALIARGEQRISEAELERIQMNNRLNNELATELKEVSHLLHENSQKLASAYDAVLRTTIRAPQSGTVTGLKSLSIGGVIAPGTLLMEIIPENEDMFIEVKVMPNNIEAIASAKFIEKHVVNIDGLSGIKTKVRLTAFNSKKVGMLDGVMTYVSANTIVEPRTGMHYYLAHVRIPKSELARIKTRTKLYPGMPAIVFITSESRTLLSYLFTPITATFETAFRER
ncbi:type I secretion membrane fusion, HlyD family protein [Neorickettsia helminthoeca str. Oregon]|uniref:Membrane fusion protein (MFP) family protein n=1 Tax=Neorickettsia helminthoeca str. Oregon TaxID=1286528 RepID=X5HMU2_9RICK|nr:HlyD family type I secretion periplasmic adaptor subunit [Neorickettsia helminthoeca]AHX11815.1 type I secretion membrane fusion, HlyD family protein [Neorickettsia helminthoeca str. Oregon]